ncbi:hypothetical protein BBO99_00007011 [Phytophthora kernoviae]|uniref:Uncharacterized protein n=2 Tax=Phytophthora kernoviae TaxID=325452 RepID=A0A421GJE5_9STRA|nr:hypothetical protein G195_007922 [Phytophthora kernoviae 00238/432]KAG2512929.1 hypothetical protein JM16_006634 [Phytophthora kernoviae]KAG2516742.1 hypothetical protein JM18_006480 [Phytophthora kernoviae]RLN45853.1 hypothetical protein BBI17_007022 [Phytophthora kernoviae]RLN77107.1 hypothetical protein BBO99_00007011 [Phytophthora kernoviae]
MSFLEREEDADAMLAEALAFIDECDGDKKLPKTQRARNGQALGSKSTGKEYVFEDEDTVKTNSSVETSVEDETMSIIAQLEKSVESLYLASDSVFPPDLPATISCNTRIKRTDDSQGNCIEVVTTTPVSCSLRVAADVVWKDLNVKGQDPERIYHFIQRRKPDSLEKNFLIALHNPSGVLKIDGFQFMRKYEEPDRVVLIKANTLTLSNMGLRFRDRCWIIISRSNADPKHAAVARTCYQLYAEGSENFSTREDIVQTRDYILSSLSGKVRRDHQMLQNLLIEEDRRAASRVVSMTA